MKRLEKMILAALFVFSTINADAAEFTVQKGHYLWHEWEDTYKSQWSECATQSGRMTDWRQFEIRTALWNWGNASLDRFKKLDAGTHLQIPPSPCATAQAGENGTVAASLKAENDKLKNDYRTFKTESDRAIAELQKELRRSAAAGHTFWTHAGALWLLLLCIIAVIAAAVTLVAYLRSKRSADPALYVSRDEYDARVTELEKRGGELALNLADKNKTLADLSATNKQLHDELEVKTFFLDKYAVPYKLKQSFGKFMGKHDTIYLQRARPIDGKDAVFIHGINEPVLVKSDRGQDNILEKLGKADAAVLDFYGIEKTEVITARTKPSVTAIKTPN